MMGLGMGRWLGDGLEGRMGIYLLVQKFEFRPRERQTFFDRYHCLFNAEIQNFERDSGRILNCECC